MSLLLLTISTRVPEEMKESIVAEAPGGAQLHRQLPPRPLEVGGVGRAAQAQVQEDLAGEIEHLLGGTAKAQRAEGVGRVAGTMVPATRGATTPVTPGAITKMTGPIHGLMHPNRNRGGVPIVAMEVKAGVMVEMVPDRGPTAIGGSPKKVQAQWAGTATATGQGLDVGASLAEPTPAAATPG